MNNILIEKSSIDFEDNGEFILKENGNKDIRVNDNVDITLTIINEEDKDVSYNLKTVTLYLIYLMHQKI